MSAGIRDRFRRLGGCDRLLLLVAAVTTLAGIPANYFRVRGGALFFTFGPMILWPVIIGVVAWSMIRQQRRPANYGFSLNRGGVASLAVLAAIHICLAIGGKLDLTATDSYLWRAGGVFMEELLIRAILINALILLMDGIEGKVFWAILVSSALWALPHIPSKSPAQLLGGIFLGGLAFGYVYYKSGSILLPLWLHGVANAGYLGGLWITALYCLLAVADRAIGPRNRQTSRPVGFPDIGICLSPTRKD